MKRLLLFVMILVSVACRGQFFDSTAQTGVGVTGLGYLRVTDTIRRNAFLPQATRLYVWTTWSNLMTATLICWQLKAPKIDAYGDTVWVQVDACSNINYTQLTASAPDSLKVSEVRGYLFGYVAEYLKLSVDE